MLGWLRDDPPPVNTRRHLQALLATPDPPEMVALDGASRGTRPCAPPKPKTLADWRRIYNQRSA